MQYSQKPCRDKNKFNRLADGKIETLCTCAGNAGTNYLGQVQVNKDEAVIPCKDIS